MLDDRRIESLEHTLDVITSSTVNGKSNNMYKQDKGFCVDKILEIINTLQRAEFGDLVRLTRIKNRITDGYIMKDDVDYVEQLYDKFKTSRGGSINQKSSRAWYLLPIFLWIVGGLASYAYLRKRDPKRATNTLILGSTFFGLFVTILAIGSISDTPQVEETIDKIDEVDIHTNPNTRNDHKPLKQVNSTTQETKTHRISYDDIPDYVDSAIVISALDNAIQLWESNNPHVDFQVVESDSELEMAWSKWMMGPTLGAYSTYNSTDNGMTVTHHRIVVRMGNDDCHSNYQQYSTESLTHTIAHELGHYLGLRHISDRDHLMHSEELFGVDSIMTYDNQGYTVPKILEPTVRTLVAQNLAKEIDILNHRLDQIIIERQDIRDGLDKDTTSQSALESNSKKYNELAYQLDEFRNQINCLEG